MNRKAPGTQRQRSNSYEARPLKYWFSPGLSANVKSVILFDEA
jgi:hypothetical protein